MQTSTLACCDKWRT